MMRIDSTWMGAHDQGRFPFTQPEPVVLRLFEAEPAVTPDGNVDLRATEHLRAPLVAPLGALAGEVVAAGEMAFWTLPEFFERYAMTFCLPKASPRNIDQYRESLDLWRRLSGDPPLNQIDPHVCARFASLVAQRTYRGQPIADRTVRKHLVHLQFCLDRAGPPNRRRALNAGVLLDPPLIEKPQIVEDETVEHFTLQEIGEWLDACRFAGLPRAMKRFSPPVWWRSLIVVLYNTGLRIGEARRLRWDWFRDDSFGRWARLPRHATKTKRARDCYFNAHALAALEALPRIDETVFAISIKPRSLQTRRRQTLAPTSIPPARRFGFHSLRKCLGTQLGMMNGTAAALALGHASKSVTLTSYTHRAVMVDSLNRLPQPPRSAETDPQGRLFE